MQVKIGDKLIGDGQPCFIIGESGINHSGCMKTASDLITAAAFAGLDAVKFQKRTVDVVYTQEELDRPRVSPFGDTNGDLKRGLEFNDWQYDAIDLQCREHGLIWFASCWDLQSVDFIEQFNPPCYKIASASLTDDDLLRRTRATGKPIILSTGMSTLGEIDHAVDVLGLKDLVILHCTSTYPTAIDELNLSAIPKLKERYGVPVGYSGHEDPRCRNLRATEWAVALGACMIERHITLDHTAWGSDQNASMEPYEVSEMVKGIRLAKRALGDGQKVVYATEEPIKEKLRRIWNKPVQRV